MAFIGILYMSFYKLNSAFGQTDMPRYNAILILSIFSIFNWLTALSLLGILLNDAELLKPSVLSIITGGAIIAFNSFLVYGDKRYLRFEAIHADLPKTMVLRNNLITAAYVVLTVFFFILSLIGLSPR